MLLKFLRCSQACKANFLFLLVLAKNSQCSACSRMLAKTIRHPYWTAADIEASIPPHAYFWYDHARVALTQRSKNRSERKPSSLDRINPACKARVVFLYIFYRARESNTRRGEETACSEGPIFTFSTTSDCA